MFRAAVGPWDLAVAAEINAAQDDAPPGFVDEPAALHSQFLHDASHPCSGMLANRTKSVAHVHDATPDQAAFPQPGLHLAHAGAQRSQVFEREPISRIQREW